LLYRFAQTYRCEGTFRMIGKTLGNFQCTALIGKGGTYWKAADGTGDVESLASLPNRGPIPWSWSKDGKAIVYMESGAGSIDIGMMSMEGDRAKTALLHEKQDEYYPRLSPDGRWLAYQSDESGQGEVYVRSFPDVNKKRCQVSNSGGFGPLWSPDGRELFYRSSDAVMAVAVETEPAFKPETPRILFRGTYFVENMVRQIRLANWDISPDGKGS
jgi:dipeptidyl aminopeptidase/acylaminoacyl peptidase